MRVSLPVSFAWSRCFHLLNFFALVFLCGTASAQMIRDEEIERILKRVSTPIFEAANLDPGSVRIYLLANEQLNAFVAGGQNLFIHTGLLMRSETLDQVAGVIAHETGHIAGGHLSRLGGASRNAATEALVGALLGAAAAVAGAPQLGTAIMAGGATVAERNLLAFSRSQEQAADQAAISYLQTAGRSPDGLLQFFRILETRNLRISVDGAEFLRTHPLTRNRIIFLENQSERSALHGKPESELDRIEHQRMVAKLDGFLDDKAQVMQRWQGETVADRYARAIAHYRASEIDIALDLLGELLAETPEDPWFLELEGQILFETGRTGDAIGPYRQANAIVDDSALLKLGLARALIESDEEPDEAIELLREATVIEPRNPTFWRFLGVALGRNGEEGEASLAFAEHAVLSGNREDADLYLSRARKHVSQGDPGWVHLLDLERAASEI